MEHMLEQLPADFLKRKTADTQQHQQQKKLLKQKTKAKYMFRLTKMMRYVLSSGQREFYGLNQLKKKDVLKTKKTDA